MGAVGRSGRALIQLCIEKIAGYWHKNVPAAQRYTDSWSRSCMPTCPNVVKKPNGSFTLNNRELLKEVNHRTELWKYGSMLIESIFRDQPIGTRQSSLALMYISLIYL